MAQGSFDSAQIADLIGLYILYCLTDTNSFELNDVGIYRDDGLIIVKNSSGPKADRIRKEITRKFKKIGFKIDVKSNIKIVDFLDVTFNISNNTIQNYMKPNNSLIYVNTKSNHPPKVIAQIPKSVNFRLARNSSNLELFNKYKEEYQTALEKSGHKSYDFKYPISNNNNKRNKNRKRNCIRFLPPYNKMLKTNIGKRFLNLISKHFPPGHMLQKIINKNNVKIGYSCTENIGRIIQNHNISVKNKNLKNKNKNLKNKSNNKKNNEKMCSCHKKEECVLQNKCMSKEIVYKARIYSKEEPNIIKIYYGITKPEFKARLANHTISFKNENRSLDTELSKEMWRLKRVSKTPQITWEIEHKSKICNSLYNTCRLCLWECISIINFKATKRKNEEILNSRNEIALSCIHRKCYLLDKYI